MKEERSKKVGSNRYDGWSVLRDSYVKERTSYLILSFIFSSSSSSSSSSVVLVVVVAVVVAAVVVVVVLLWWLW